MPSNKVIDQKAAEIFSDTEFLSKLIVGIGEVAEITGLPARQIRYWEEKGLITSMQDGTAKTRRYNYMQLKKILLIKDLMDEGFTLEASAKKVDARMESVTKIFEQLKKKK
jgi:DNA-binding transcriptional MerR regulator